MSIHQLIKARREALGLSPARLAARVSELLPEGESVSRQTVQHWEKDDGSGTAPRRTRLPAVAQALEIPVEQLLAALANTPGDASEQATADEWATLLDLRRVRRYSPDTHEQLTAQIRDLSDALMRALANRKAAGIDDSAYWEALIRRTEAATPTTPGSAAAAPRHPEPPKEVDARSRKKPAGKKSSR